MDKGLEVWNKIKNEDILQIENDLKLNQCMSLFLERGQVIVGGNIEQRGNRLFETGEALQLILLGTHYVSS